MAETKYPPNPLPCGCEAVGIVDLASCEKYPQYKQMFVRFCPLHQAAPELLEALKNIEKATLADWRCYTKRYAVAALDLIRSDARAAIAKAESAAAGRPRG